MLKSAYILSFFLVLTSCQTSIPSGNEIVFADVIGSYEGECADYTSSASDLMNREESTLSVVAVNTNSAGIRTSCNRLEDQSIPVKTASASKIEFQKSENGEVITMTYYAEQDSIVLIQSVNSQSENLIFIGNRS